MVTEVICWGAEKNRRLAEKNGLGKSILGQEATANVFCGRRKVGTEKTEGFLSF